MFVQLQQGSEGKQLEHIHNLQFPLEWCGMSIPCCFRDCPQDPLLETVKRLEVGGVALVRSIDSNVVAEVVMHESEVELA